MLEQILTDVLYVLIMAAIAAISSKLIPLIQEKINGIKCDDLKEYIELSVQYAENKLKDLKGTDKFNYVFNSAVQWCIDHKIQFTDEQLQNMIEGLYNLLDFNGLVNMNKEK